MMDPTKSVRIKYVNEETLEIETRVTGAVIPRTGEKVAIQEWDEEINLTRDEWFTVEDVHWRVVDAPERKPDVAEVRLSPVSEETDP